VTAGGAEGADLVAAHGVDGLAKELGDVEAVEDMNNERTALSHDAEERLPHVARDERDGLRALLAEHVEART